MELSEGRIKTATSVVESKKIKARNKELTYKRVASKLTSHGVA